MRRARVSAASSGHAVIVKRLSLPAMSQAELGDAIPWEAEQYIPFDLSEVQLDYQVVNSSATGADGKASLDVLLVAAKRDRIDDRAGVISQTGPPAGRDRHRGVRARQRLPDELSRAHRSVRRRSSTSDRNVTIVCLLERGEPVFTRDISIGGQVHLDAVLRELGGSGVDELAAKRILHGQFPQDVSPDQVATVLREASAPARARGAQDDRLLSRHGACREAQPHRALRRRVAGRRPGRPAGE